MALIENDIDKLSSVVELGLENHLRAVMEERISPLRDEIVKELDDNISLIIEETCKKLQVTINSQANNLTLQNEVLIKWALNQNDNP